MRMIGLTGGISSGKSNISDMLRSLGAVIIDGDRLSRELTAPGGFALPAIRQHFGDGVFCSDGSLDRKTLGAIVFSDVQAKQALDRIMQPMLLEQIQNRIQQAKMTNAPACVLDMPLLYETGLDRLCDTVWCAWIPEPLQLKRLMERDGYSREQAMQRIRSQMPTEEKAARANVVINTSGTIEETRAQIPALYQKEIDVQTRRRRVDRYQNMAAVPTVIKTQSSVQKNDVPVQQSSNHHSSEIPDVMERPVSAQKKLRQQRRIKEDWRLPNRLLLGILIVFFLSLGLFTADALMKAWLKESKESREAAFLRVVENHPLLFRDYIEKYAEEYNLEPAFVAAIIMNESSFRTTAESSVGARGLMQLMPDTAEWIAHKLQINDYSFARMYDAESNIRFGCWYLNYLSVLFRGDPVSVSCAYHAGQGTVTAWLSDPAKTDDGYSLKLDSLTDGPTKSYAGEVTQDYGIYKVLYFSTENDTVSGTDTITGLSAG